MELSNRQCVLAVVLPPLGAWETIRRLAMKRVSVLAAITVVVGLASAATIAFSKVVPGNATSNYMMAPRMGDATHDIPARAPTGYARADTIDFGYFTVIGGAYYAVQGEIWTWDHGSNNVTEGWYSVDYTADAGAYFRHITEAAWASDPLNPSPAPIINGAGSAWVGLFEGEARALCWDAGLGYGNGWCQRLVSPILNYDGSGEVALTMKYWNDTEANFDYSKVVLRVGAEMTVLNDPGFSGVIAGVVPGPPPQVTHAVYNREITNGDFGGGPQARNFQIVFEFESDGGWSDQDGYWATSYGPFAADDVTLANNLTGGDVAYDFDAGLQGWTAEACPGIGSYFGIAPLSDYEILDPCECFLEGNVVEMHTDAHTHPIGQFEGLYSPPADRSALQAYNKIFADWDQYSDLPRNNGVFYRSGWNYYPYICESTGESIWSGRRGQTTTWYYTGESPVCARNRDVATDFGIPPECEQIGFVFEIYSSCEIFGIPEDYCTGVTNFTPVIDNVRIRMTQVPNAPVVDFDTGATFQDGFGQGLILSTTDTGNADITFNLQRHAPGPDRLGDSLVIRGPVPTTSTRWLARLWFRVRREGPGQAAIPGYSAWKTKVSDGLDIVGANGQFTFGWMDSLEVGTQVARNRFVSQFHEMDDDHTPPEQGEENEIIQDGILAPGTKIEYFITSAYTCTPTEFYYLPDTSGRNYMEFEILPSYRNVAGVPKFPCVLYVDAYNRGAQFYIENALNGALNGAGPGAPIPDPTTWDRYDYMDATSNWNAPMFRNIGGNAGASLPQLLGYRMILVNTGTFGATVMEVRDWQGFGNWLSSTTCDSHTWMKGWYGTGDNLSQAIGATYPTFLNHYLGATALCPSYANSGCPPGETENDEQYCVRLEYVAGGPWEPSVELDVFGNWCPYNYTFDVMGTTGAGLANKRYRKIGSDATANFAQVTLDRSGGTDNHRTVIDGYSSHHLSKRDLGNPGPGSECPHDSSSVVEAIHNEIREAIKWTLNIADPLVLQGLCEDPCGTVDVLEPAIGSVATRLFQNHPNPFNPRTTIRFALAENGPARLVIFDVNGRRVRTLVDGAQTAGNHDVVWDGMDDAGNPVASGVFWSQLTAGSYVSNKKMVILK